MNKPFYPAIVFYSDEDQGYIAKAVDLKGCSAFGETPEQALKELETAVELWLSVAEQDHVEIPAPSPITAFG
ncbi:MAG: type II toxin-antitoxin system HicB family antitoxin [Deltaproteobacteria bacterium]|nr:type II toxin-antitoxin system HicB family antitoxin [Deltaproteobacteria bacterium]